MTKYEVTGEFLGEEPSGQLGEFLGTFAFPCFVGVLA
jgi:hypothetical protein